MKDWREHEFWRNIPEDCKKAIKELKRMKVYRLIATDYEETFSDVWWLVLHEVDMYAEGEFCREASRSCCGEGEPTAMNYMQAWRADEWLMRWLPLFNKYKGDECHTEAYLSTHSGYSKAPFVYRGQI